MSVYVIDKNNEKRLINYTLNDFYEGVDFGDVNSQTPQDVTALWYQEKILILRVDAESTSYYIEPLENKDGTMGHLHFAFTDAFLKPSSLNASCRSDFGDEMARLTIDAPLNESTTHRTPIRSRFVESNNTVVTESDPTIRNYELRSRCPLLVTVDYTYFKNIGKNDIGYTIAYVVALMFRANKPFLKTAYGFIRSYGMDVTTILIHEEYSDKKSGQFQYNIDSKQSIEEMLKSFSIDGHLKNYCLAHLLTYTDHKSDIGLSHVGFPAIWRNLGICANVKLFRNNMFVYGNTGLSTHLFYGRQLLMAQSDNLVAHELGHGWGSLHDPQDNPICYPGPENGGNYLMAEKLALFLGPNSRTFSPCSIQNMALMLYSVAISEIYTNTRCFKVPTFECGNGETEGEEQCDHGGQADVCCDKYCRLKSPDYQCSDENHVCCQNCMFANTSELCKSIPQNGCASCGGECIDNRCIFDCLAMGYSPCTCSQVVYSCTWCCRQINSSQCHAMFLNDKPIDLPDYTKCQNTSSCIHGICTRYNISSDIQVPHPEHGVMNYDDTTYSSSISNLIFMQEQNENNLHGARWILYSLFNLLLAYYYRD